jgi:trehalose synthase-fused probable maltokinase
MTVPVFPLDRFSLDLPALASVLPAALPHFLPRQRWFGKRSTPIRQSTVLDVIPIADPDLPVAITLARVELTDGTSAVYQLLLATADPRSVDPQHAIAELRLPQGACCLYDVLGNAADCEKLLQAVRRLPSASASGARLVVEWSAALDELAPPFKARPMAAEQSNSSVVFGKGAILKVFRRVQPGINPDIEVTRVLTASGFTESPRYLGSWTYAPAEGGSATLAGIQQYVTNQGDGWSSALADLRAWFDDPSAPRLQGHARGAAELGQVTARLHRALAATSLPAFAPQPVVAEDLHHWLEAALGRLDRVAHVLSEPERNALTAMLERLPAVQGPGDKLRIHGDYHLGQVLRSAERWVVFDFEGEPARGLGDRVSRYPAARDVAGMLRSYDYAAFAAAFERAAPGSGDWGRLEPLAGRWQDALREGFLQGWMQGVRGAGFVPSDPQSLHALLQFFELDKAIYELQYELDHRPDWLRIPLQGIRRILARRPG